MNITNQLQQNNIEFGHSRKIPRYIYHMTSKANYESMLRDGYIKTSDYKLHVDKGIYAFDLPNFYKRWGINKDWGYDDLQRIILRHIVKWTNSAQSGSSDLVILRIPTSNLDIDKLSVRSLNKLFSFEQTETFFRNLGPKLQEHLAGNTPAREAPLYTRRKDAIEFIYKDNIPIENAEQIGNIVNVAELRKDDKFTANPVKFIMQNLLAGTSEVKGANLMK